MSQIDVKRFFYVTSGTQLTGSTNTFSVPLQIPDYENYDRISLIQANIPISYYMIQTGFNTFTLRENSTDVTITIPPGNYNANSFSLVVSALLNSNSPNGLTYTITYPINYTENNTGKFTYSVNTILVTCSIICPSSNDLFEQFGFISGSTNTFTVGSVSSTLESTNVIKFIPEDSVFIHCNLTNNGYDDVLQEIFFSNNTIFANQTWLNPDPLALSKKLNPGQSQFATFSLTNENNLPLYLNGLSIQFSLMLYKDATFYKKAERYMKFSIKEKISNIV